MWIVLGLGEKELLFEELLFARTYSQSPPWTYRAFNPISHCVVCNTFHEFVEIL
jgi:hypothetical protein